MRIRFHVYLVSCNSYGRRWDLITLLSRPERMPLRNRRSLWLSHSTPVGNFMGPRAVFPQNDPPDEFVFTFRIIVPDGDDNTGILKLLWIYVEADRLIIHRVNCRFLEWCFFSFNGLLEVHHCNFHEWICKNKNNEIMERWKLKAEIAYTSDYLWLGLRDLIVNNAIWG